MKFDDMVHFPDEIEALSLEEFSFTILDLIEGTGMPSDDDFRDPPSRNPLPKAVLPLQDRSKFGQHPVISLKSLSDRVDAIAKNPLGFALEQNKMMQLMTTMKNKMFSNFSAIMAILSDFQGSRSGRVKNQPQFSAKGKEMTGETDVDCMEVYN